MSDELVIFQNKPADARFLIAGWRRQWSDGGNISGGLPRYLIEKLEAKKIGELGPKVSDLCYPFQVAGTHDTFRPRASYEDGLPSKPMHRDNCFYDAGGGLIIFRGQEPWFRVDIFAEAFCQAIVELGVKQTAAVEGVNGPGPSGKGAESYLRLQQSGHAGEPGKIRHAVFQLWQRRQKRAHHCHGPGHPRSLRSPGLGDIPHRGHGPDVPFRYLQQRANRHQQGTTVPFTTS